MLIKENIFPNGDKVQTINSFDGAVVTTNGKLVEATAGDETKFLKAYIQIMGSWDRWLTDGEVYSIGVDFENLSDDDMSVYFKGMSLKSRYKINPNFKGRLVDTSAKRDLDHVQIQISSTDYDKGVKFRYDNISVNKGKPSELWIPAKVDLKNPTLYPQDGNYEEIKAS